MYLGFFYYTIGNISPKFRSSLKAIQLVAVAKSSVIEKYGASVVLQSFMESIKVLEVVHIYYVVCIFYVFNFTTCDLDK